MPRRLAHVLNGLVTQVSEGADDDAQHQAWLAAVADLFDDIIDVSGHQEALGYGVNVGDSYSESDGFRPPSPYPSWVWEDGGWAAPVPYPDDGGSYEWDEESQSWATVGPLVMSD